VRASRGSPNLLSRFLDTRTDVQSLMDAKEEADRDSSLSLVEKGQIQRLLDHCSDQMQFVSNEQRLEISLSRYLADFDRQSSSSLVNHSTGLL